jgi:hypothetical protein
LFYKCPLLQRIPEKGTPSGVFPARSTFLRIFHPFPEGFPMEIVKFGKGPGDGPSIPVISGGDTRNIKFGVNPVSYIFTASAE